MLQNSRAIADYKRFAGVLAQGHGVGFPGPGRISLFYSLLGAFPAAGEVGQVLRALHLMLKDIVAGESRSSPEIEAFAELVVFRLGRALQYDPISGKKYGQGSQVHTASAGTVNIL